MRLSVCRRVEFKSMSLPYPAPTRMNVFGIDFTSRQRGASLAAVCIVSLREMFCVPVIWKNGTISMRLSWRCKGTGHGLPALISRLARHDGLLKRSAGHAGGGITFAMHSL